MSLKSKIKEFFKKASKLPAAPKRDFHLNPKDAKLVHDSNAAFRRLKQGTPSHGWFGIADRLTRKVAKGHADPDDLRATWAEMKSAGQDKPSRHVHPRHLRVA